MTDPARYHECSNLRLRRPSDVSGHIARCHLLQEKILVTGRDTESADEAETVEEMQQTGTCKSPDGIKLYHPRCRMEFFGRDAAENLKRHCDEGRCPLMGIEETGMLLPEEFDILLSESKKVTSSVAKWYAMWGVCFPPLSTSKVLTVPPSPYLEMTVSRELGQELVLQALNSVFMENLNLNSICDQIISGIYLGKSQTDAEVRQIVQGQQQQRMMLLQQAQYEELYRSVSSYPQLQPSGFPPYDVGSSGFGYIPSQEEYMDLDFDPTNLNAGNYNGHQ
ncbi:hypothetical protein IL306_002339 [Fusarium sp. DS 682]|nr:hypothetical protein IL306_002339 [Fusarium sp. DS 682]